ncbi:MAG: N-formylglutamate amidohydrolase [Ramlibacter sp.]|jgi:N-formylglutamate deformylase|nr:N-formylglutamate amidohydrolase [Ramlibacter sp.]
MSFQLNIGTSPLLVSMPHVGTEIPEELRSDYVPRAQGVEDTDWHLARLYNCLPALGASVLRPRYSRYVIDLNRPPDDAPMYPGASNTELCPTRFFSGDALYREGQAPSAEERRRRRETYWQPYHDALAGELARIKAEHGFVLLWDAHSIRSEIPWLFEGVLPDLNIGTTDGASAHPAITQAVAGAAARFADVSHVVNGRFKGGYITRHYGNPQGHVHAVQLEMCQSLYMGEEPPYEYDSSLASGVQPVLRDMLAAALAACRGLYGR